MKLTSVLLAAWCVLCGVAMFCILCMWAWDAWIEPWWTRRRTIHLMPGFPELDDDHGGLTMPGLHAQAILKNMRTNQIMKGYGPHNSVPPGTTWPGVSGPSTEAPPPMKKATTNHTTLDAAWADALLLGATEVKEPPKEDRAVSKATATIQFSTSRGSNIYARGVGSCALEALNNALDEALALQAGVIFAGKE